MKVGCLCPDKINRNTRFHWEVGEERRGNSAPDMKD